MPGKIIPSSGTEGKNQIEKNESVAADFKKLVRNSKIIKLDWFKENKEKQ